MASPALHTIADDIRVNFLRCEHRTFLNVDDYWLGLDIVQSTAWYDGNPSTYRNWYIDEPNGAIDECFYFLDGKMADDHYTCGALNFYICKKAAGSVPATVVYAN